MKRAKYISNGTITYKIVGEQGPQGPKGEVGPQGPQGPIGKDGRELELQATETEVQWRYSGSQAFNKLFDIPTGAFVYLKFVTPQMFGAKGDGTTDDTNAFQLAINTGKTVVVPEGTYSIGNLTVSRDNPVSIIGENCKTTIIKPNLTGVTIKYSGLSGNYYQDIKLSNISFIGDESKKSEEKTAIMFERCARIHVENVLIEYYKLGISSSTSWNMLYVNTCCYYNIKGYEFTSENHVAVSNQFIHCTADNNEIGLDIINGTDVYWDGGEIGGNTNTGIIIGSSGNGDCFNIEIKNVTMENNEKAISVGSEEGTSLSTVLLSNNYIFRYEKKESIAIEIKKCSKVTLMNNYITKYSTGIKTGSYCNMSLVSNRIFEYDNMYDINGNLINDDIILGVSTNVSCTFFNSNGNIQFTNTAKSGIKNNCLVMNNGELKFKKSDGKLYKIMTELDSE